MKSGTLEHSSVLAPVCVHLLTNLINTGVVHSNSTDSEGTFCTTRKADLV